MSDEPIGTLVLRQAGKRTSGTWGLDDYDVIDSRGREIGRISKPRAGVPPDHPWEWAITGAVVIPHLPSHGFCTIRDEAKANLAETWRAWLALATLKNISDNLRLFNLVDSPFSIVFRANADAGDTMKEQPHAKAYQAIGAYFCAFSALERELGEALKVIFRLQQHEAADTIIAALGNFARKANLVRAAAMVAKNVDGSETSDAWKRDAGDLMKKILARNQGDRVVAAHSFLEANEDGSVKLTRLHLPDGVLKSREELWTQEEFTAKSDELIELTNQLRRLTEDLSTFTIKLPDLGWMHVDPYRPPPRRRPPSDLHVDPIVPPEK